jgi:hypothetical protein
MVGLYFEFWIGCRVYWYLSSMYRYVLMYVSSWLDYSSVSITDDLTNRRFEGMKGVQ